MRLCIDAGWPWFCFCCFAADSQFGCDFPPSPNQCVVDACRCRYVDNPVCSFIHSVIQHLDQPCLPCNGNQYLTYGPCCAVRNWGMWGACRWAKMSMWTPWPGLMLVVHIGKIWDGELMLITRMKSVESLFAPSLPAGTWYQPNHLKVAGTFA